MASVRSLSPGLAPRATLLASTALLAALTIVPVPALSQAWDGSANGNWFNGNNWAGNTPPTNTTDATIGAAPNDPRIGNGPTTAEADTVTVQDQGRLTVAGTLDALNAGEAGIPQVTVEAGGRITIEATGEVQGGITTAGNGRNEGTVDALTVTDGRFTNAGQVTGGTEVSGGTLVLNAGTNLADDRALTVTGGRVEVNADDAVGNLAGTGGEVALTGNLTVGGGGNNAIYDGQITGTGDLVKEGAGRLRLTADSTHSGQLTVEEGEVQFSGAGATDARIDIAAGGTVTTDGGAFNTATRINNNGGTLDLNGSESIRTLDSTGSVDIAAGQTLTLNGGVSDIGGTMSGAGGLTIAGGTTNLTGAAGITGATNVTGGTLNLSGAGTLGSTAVAVNGAGTLVSDGGALAAGATVTVGTGGTFTANGTDTVTGLTQTGGTVNGTGTVNTGNFTQSGGRTGGSVDINTTTFTQSGGAVIADGTSVTATGAQTLQGGTIRGALDGTGAVTVNTGTTAVRGAGTIASTNIDIDSGELVTDGGALAGGAAIENNATLTISGDETIRRLFGTGTVNVNGAGTALTLTDGTSNLDGTLQGRGGLTVDGGTVRINGTNALQGDTTVNSGTLGLNSGNAIADGSSLVVNGTGVVNLNADETVGGLGGTGGTLDLRGSVLTIQGTGSDNFGGNISGNAASQLVQDSTFNQGISGNITTAGSVLVQQGTLTLSGNNSIAGGITIAGDSTLRLESDTAGGGGTITTLGSTVDYADGVNSGTAINLNSNDTNLNVATGAAEQSGNIGETGGPRGLEKTGNGTLTLSGTNTYTGTTTISDGTLALAGGSAIVDTGAVTVAAGAALQVDANETVGSVSGAGGVTLNATLTTGGAGTNDTISGVISGAGGLVKEGAGTLTLTRNNTYTGATDVNAGTLALTGGGRLGSTDIETAAGGTLTTDGNALAAGANLANAGQFTITGTESIASLNGSGGVALNGGNLFLNAGASIVGGTITGTGVLTVRGTSTTTLNAVNTHTGGTGVIGGGTLNIGATGAIDALTVANNGTANNAGTTGNVTVAAGGTFNNAPTGNSGAVTTRGTGNNAGTVASLRVNDGTFTNAGTVTGATTVAAGTLNLNAGTNLSDAEALTVNGGTVNVNANDTVGALTGTGGEVALTGTLTAGANGTSTTYRGLVSGTGGLTKTGAGRLTLTANNTFSGVLNVAAGTVAVTGAGELATNSITTGAGGTLRTDGDALSGTLALTNGGALVLTGSESIGSITGAGGVALTGAATNLSLTTGTSNVGGVISGDGRLTVAGGDVTLTAANTYSGATTVTSGTLALTGAGAIASTDVQVSDGTLSTDGGALASGATVQVSGTGTLAAGGSETVAAVQQSNGTIGGTGVLNTTTFTQTGGTVAAGANVSASGAQSLQGGTIAGTLGGAGAVTVSGSTTVTGTGLIASNSVTVASGTLDVTGGADNNALSDTATVTINGTGQLDITGADTVGTVNLAAGSIGGTGTLGTGAFNQSGGTIAAGATVSGSGVKTLSGGTISGTLGGAGTVNVNGTATVDPTGQITGAGAINVLAGSTLTSTGRVETTGTLSNAGTANLAGVLNGNVNNTGFFNAVGGDLAGGTVATFTNFGALAVEDSRTFSGVGVLDNRAGSTTTLGANARLNAATVTNRGNVAMGGGARIVGAVSNLGGFAMSDGSIITGNFTNGATGTLTVNGNATVTGSMTAASQTALTNMRDNAVGDTLTVGGLLSGGTYALDINLGNQTGDRVIAGSVDATKTLTFQSNNLALGLVPIGNRVTILTGANIQNTFNAGNFVLQSPGSAVVQVLRVNDTGGLDVVAETSSGIGGLAASVSSVQSLISSVVNRPTSPFSGGPAAEQTCFSGGFARMTAGKATIDAIATNQTSTISTSTTQVSANYGGIQAGYDIGCNDGRFLDGWNGAAGVMLGYNAGSTGQTVFVPNGTASPLATSNIDSDFDQSYFGFYVAGAKENLSADLTLRFDRTSFDFTEQELITGSALGVDGSSLSSDSIGLVGRLTYIIEISDELSFAPTAGVALTRTEGGDVQIGDPASGGVLTLDDYNSNVIFVGGTLARSRINDAGTAANQLFVSGNYYSDTAGQRGATFSQSSGASEQISLDNLGGFGEVSLGWNYFRLLENGPAGARQLNSSVRLDTRFGEQVYDSVSITAQVRLVF